MSETRGLRKKVQPAVPVTAPATGATDAPVTTSPMSESAPASTGEVIPQTSNKRKPAVPIQEKFEALMFKVKQLSPDQRKQIYQAIEKFVKPGAQVTAPVEQTQTSAIRTTKF